LTRGVEEDCCGRRGNVEIHIRIRLSAPFSPQARSDARVQSVDDNQSLLDPTRMIAMWGSVAPRRFSVLVIGIFAGVALVLAGTGLYGVVS